MSAIEQDIKDLENCQNWQISARDDDVLHASAGGTRDGTTSPSPRPLSCCVNIVVTGVKRSGQQTAEQRKGSEVKERKKMRWIAKEKVAKDEAKSITELPSLSFRAWRVNRQLTNGDR
jgi:hypothetical protein